MHVKYCKEVVKIFQTRNNDPQNDGYAQPAVC